MRINLRAVMPGVAIGLALGLSGCAGMQERNLFKGLELPSPGDTVKASDTQSPSRTAGIWGRNKKAAPAKANEADSQFALDVLLGRNHEQAGEFDKARKVYEDLRRKRPDDLEVVHRLGVVADLQKRHPEAEGLFLLALERQPRNADLLADLGYCYFLQGKLTKAESALGKAVALEPSNQRFKNNLGLVLGHLGRYEEALAMFRQAGTEADAYYNLAFVYAAQDRNEQAKLSFNHALVADPTHTRSREALASFHEFDRLPEHLRDDALIAEDGVRYVPFIEEDGRSADRSVQAASVDVPLPTGRTVSQANRSLFQQARSQERAQSAGQANANAQ